VLDLDKIYRDAKGKCCLSVQEVGCLLQILRDAVARRARGRGGKTPA
jgi:hypothetical protein